VGRDSVEPTKSLDDAIWSNNLCSMPEIDLWDHSGRRNPATGVLISRDRPTILFLTVCTLHRRLGLAQPKAHESLVQVWTEADAWSVGAYVLMPDHMHLFCAPKREEVTIEQWIVFWKRQFRRRCGSRVPRFQSRGFHHRLRRDENYHQKWEYVRANPVRAGFVKTPEEWPYHGILNHLPWW
jgi:putative transposase